jgi:hypothetical protein
MNLLEEFGQLSGWIGGRLIDLGLLVYRRSPYIKIIFRFRRMRSRSSHGFRPANAIIVGGFLRVGNDAFGAQHHEVVI